MSRINKWKLEKAKVKVVFRLQFHATHIPQTGWEKLFISFISADTGKAIAKTTKANVRNGACKWADPIYETTRLLQDTKSKQYDEKLYKIVVAMGSSRASILGEATVNLAEYVDALKPSSVALPLNGCNFGTILHVTVQLLTSKTGFREFEQQRELRSGFDSHGDSTTGKPYSEEITNDHTDKVGARVKLKPDAAELSSHEEEVNLNEDYADSNSAAGFDGSSNTSESLHAEKHDLDCSKSNTSSDMHVLSNCQSPHAEKRDPPEHQNSAQGSAGSDHGWVSNYSVNNELAMACEENNRLRGSLELAESSIFNLKLEVSSLQSLADELGTETQKNSHLLATEISSSEELAKEVSVMKSECLKFKDDIINLKILKLSPQISITETSDNQFDHLLRNMQLQFLKGITVAEAKIRELQDKSFVMDHDRGTSFISSELEALLNTLLHVKRGIGEATAFPNALQSERTDVKEIRELCSVGDEKFVSQNGFGLDLCQPESIFQQCSIIPPVTEVAHPVSVIDAMKTQIFDLVRELDQAKVEKEALTRKMIEMECYYESLVLELEENQKLVLGELQLLRNEHSTCLYTLSASRTEIESMRQDMNQQMLQFSNERCEMDAFNKELERRATTSEAALRRARLNYSIAVDKLQKDLELLSSQVVSMFETNENLIKQAVVEPSETQTQRDQKLMQNPEDDDAKKISPCQNPNLGLRKRSVGGDILLEDLKKSFCLQEELYQKAEEELAEMYSLNLNLDIYSKVLQESVIDASAGTGIMKKKMDELVEELELSTASQNQLMVRLQKATEDIHTLNEYKSSSISQCSDMALQNQLLEDKFESISKENYLLAQKLKDSEIVMTEYRSYQSKFETCLAENAELSLSLKQEELENEKLQNEISLVKENLAILRAESDEIISLKENFEGDIVFLQDKLTDLLASYNKQLGVLNNSRGLSYASKGTKHAILQLEEIQQYACDKIFELMEENQNLERVRVVSELENEKLHNEISLVKENLAILRSESDEVISLKENLEEEITFLQDKLANLLASYIKQLGVLSNSCSRDYASKSIKDAILQLEEIQQYACDKIFQLMEENQNLERERVVADASLGIARSEILAMKQKLKRDKLDTVAKLDMSNALVGKLQVELESLDTKLQSSSEVEEKYARQSKVLLADLTLLEDQIQELICKKSDLSEEISLGEELGRNKSMIAELIHDKEELVISLQDKTQDSIKLALEIGCLKEDLRNSHDELYKEKACRDEMEGKVRDLASRLNESNDNLSNFEQQKIETLHFMKLASDLELEKSRLADIFGEKKVLIEKLQKEVSYQAILESQLFEMHDNLLTADVKQIYFANQYETLLEELLQQLLSSEGCLRELQKRYHDMEALLNHHLAKETHWSEEKANLLTSIESLRSHLEASEVANKLLSNSNDDIRAQLEECEQKLKMAETSFSLDKSLQASEFEQLTKKIHDAEEELDYLTVAKEELEMLAIVVKGKVSEQSADLTLLEEYKDEVVMLRSQCNELSTKLSEQVLKTEEFRNLSTHLKELKDKAEAECVLAREKREEAPPVAAQDSLRIAFMKEQYETKTQELKQQLSISKKHGEEMLLKLQDAIDEIENRKKSEAVSLKRNDELSLKLLALEEELQSAITEKRENIIAYDRTRAELECALLSLECCKEEKEKLEASMQDFEAEKSELAIELTSVKGQLENLKSRKIKKDERGSVMDIEYVLDGSSGNSSPIFLEQEESMYGIKRRDVLPIQSDESADPTEPILQIGQDATSKDVHQIPEALALVDSPRSNGKKSVDNKCLGAQVLRSSMEHLHEELEKMKNENTEVDKYHDVPDYQVQDREIMQLHKANEELRSMFPSFNEMSGGGNALERVLALEMELAEALKTKNQRNAQFQSSFLKQHSNDEAVARSFRDINELIKEMLELKGRHATMEAELREMHDRYSELSLQFAEVEGERQKLKMTLRNVRASRKLLTLNRSSSANADQLS